MSGMIWEGETGWEMRNSLIKADIAFPDSATLSAGAYRSLGKHISSDPRRLDSRMSVCVNIVMLLQTV